MKNLNSQTPSKDSLLKELFQTMDKQSITKMLAEVFCNATTSEQRGSSSKEDDIEMEDYEEAQNPNANDEEEYQKIVALYIEGNKDKTC